MKETIICRCEEVSTEEIIKAIRSGARNLNDVKRATRAAMGPCQGMTCERLIMEIIAQETGRELREIIPQTSRAPVNPIKLKILGNRR